MPDIPAAHLEKHAKKVGQWLWSMPLPLALPAVLVFFSYRYGYGSSPVSGNGFPWKIFAQHFFLATLVLSLLVFAVSASFRHLGLWRPLLSAIAIAGVIALLLAADAQHLLPPESPEASGVPGNPRRIAPPDSTAKLLYLLIVYRPALLGLSVLALGGTFLVVYFAFRLLFPFEYTGSGIQFRFPGHTVNYLPIYAQVSWQDTKIQLKKGDRISVELYGWVSPGGLQNLREWEKYTQRLVEWQKQGAVRAEWPSVGLPYTWPYEGPVGYPKRYYRGQTQLAVMRKHPLYQKPDFYREDELLTVRGCTHLQVFGIILPPGQEPRKATDGDRAYDWNTDSEELLSLSNDQYPIEVEANRSGRLWVVINDVDAARWDNVGLFFMTLTRRAWW